MSGLSPAIGDELCAALLGKVGRLLDVGCGRGETLALLAKKTCLSLYAIEPDAEKLAAARAVCARAAAGTAEQIPFEDGFFDAVICECVLSLTDIIKASAQLARVLRPGGLLLAADLYSREGYRLKNSRLARSVFAPGELSAVLIGFKQTDFKDLTPRLSNMLAQMIMDGEACMYSDELRELRRVRAGYGLWSFERI